MKDVLSKNRSSEYGLERIKFYRETLNYSSYIENGSAICQNIWRFKNSFKKKDELYKLLDVLIEGDDKYDQQGKKESSN